MKVAIVGTAPLSRGFAPYDDASWDIWACSAGNRGLLSRVTLWFEMHAFAEMTTIENKAWSTPYFEWLKTQTFPIMAQEYSELIPRERTLIYPLGEMITRFKSRNWFSSSVAYMLALAIAKGASDIGIFGVDMAAEGENGYAHQKAGCIWWIEKAKELGINVHVPMESSLGREMPLYGYWEATPLGRRMNAIEYVVRTNRDEMSRKIEAMMLERAFFNGSLEQLSYQRRVWMDGAEALDILDMGRIEADVVQMRRVASGDQGGGS